MTYFRKRSELTQALDKVAEEELEVAVSELSGRVRLAADMAKLLETEPLTGGFLSTPRSFEIRMRARMKILLSLSTKDLAYLQGGYKT